MLEKKRFIQVSIILLVSKRIASELELNDDEPYIIIEEIVDNSAFIAKKAKTFDEEKKVANKAPVEKITC